jgi:hypothetical protein
VVVAVKKSRKSLIQKTKSLWKKMGAQVHEM